MARELSDVLQVAVTEDGGVSPGVCGLGYSLPPPSVPTLLLSPSPRPPPPFFSHPHSQDVGVRVAALGGPDDSYQHNSIYCTLPHT